MAAILLHTYAVHPLPFHLNLGHRCPIQRHSKAVAGRTKRQIGQQIQFTDDTALVTVTITVSAAHANFGKAMTIKLI